GFQHPNCRHTVKLYLPGVTKAPTGPGTGPDPKGDEARQRQRAIEREIRASKRRASLALDDEARKAANTRVREWQARMREHLAEHPELRRLTYREAPGVGNTPPIDLVERLGGETPFPDLPDDDSEVSTAATAQPAWDTRSADELRAAGERATDHYRRTVALTDAEQEALDNYTGAAGAELVYGADYSNINRGLRGQQPMGEIAAAASAALDSAAARYTTPERMTTWRSLRHWDVGQLTPGDVLDDPAWQSTSFRNEGFGGRTFLEITVPKGSHGIIVNGARGGGLTEEEQEFLLPRGTRYVVEAEEMRDGKRWIKVTAMPPMSQSPGGGQR
ncbi:MAG TPA: phage minor capsid protein, partial [Naasia sp.]